MWEFRNRNVFGTTVFGSFGAFWIGLGFWVLLVEPGRRGHQACHGGGNGRGAQPRPRLDPARVRHPHYVRVVLAAQANTATFLVFFLLLVPLIILSIGNFNAGSALLPTGTIKVGGYIGLVTALVAWYGSVAGMAEGMGGKGRIPLGPPLIR